MFDVSGKEVKNLAVFVRAGETVQYIDQQNIQFIFFTQQTCSSFIVLSEANAEICFLGLCKKNVERTVQCIQFRNGSMLWKRTHSDRDKLLNYIERERTRLDKMCIETYMERGTCEASQDSIWDVGGEDSAGGR
jgi:hypothetical protein